MRDLPRSAALAAWGSAVLSGLAAIDNAVAEIQGADETHEVDLAGIDVEAPVGGLVGLFALLRRAGVTRLRLHLPVEGDVGGLPGPVEFNLAAVEAGECVVTDDPGGPAYGFVPDVEWHGAPGSSDPVDGTTSVAWRAYPVRASALAAGHQDLRECRQSLLTTLAETSASLERLDAVNWGADPEPGLDHVRSRSVSADMPPGTPGRAAQVLDLAWRVRAVVELASRNEGGTVNIWEAEQRRVALRSLESVSRHAVVAAVNAALEPAR